MSTPEAETRFGGPAAQRWVLGAPMSVADRSVPPDVGAVDLHVYCLMLGDDALVLAHRLSRWGTRAPELEESAALHGIVLDLLAQARVLLRRAGEVGRTGRGEDRLAYCREAHEFRNVRLAEVDCGPGGGGDFAASIARLYLFAAWRCAVFARLAHTRDPVLATLAARSVIALTQHRDHAAGWLIRLGGAAEPARGRAVAGLERLWPLARELFLTHPVEQRLARAGCAVDPSTVRDEVSAGVAGTLSLAGVELPYLAAHRPVAAPGGRDGVYTRAMDFLLADLQSVARSDPSVGWCATPAK